MIIKCPECGHQVSDHAQTCPSCGIAIEGNLQKCPHCGEIVFLHTVVCPNCCRDLKAKTVKAENTQDTLTVEPQRIEKEAEKETKQPEEEQPSKEHGKLMGFTIGLIVTLIVVFVGGYLYWTITQQNEKDAYQRAMLSNEAPYLELYLQQHTDAPEAYRDSVGIRLKVLLAIEDEWKAASDSCDRNALEAFVSAHPENRHYEEALFLLDSIDWSIALEANTLEEYERYASTHSDGRYIDEAMDRHKQLENQIAKQLQDSLNLADSLQRIHGINAIKP